VALVAPLLLAALAVTLTTVAPRVVARAAVFRRAPRPALVVWQAVALAAVLCVLTAGPSAVRAWPETSVGAMAAWAATSLIALRLVLTGHRVGSRLRAARREHRELVDLIGERQESRSPADPRLRVLAHPIPTAYCLPGLRRRVILSEGTLEALPPDQLAAVLAHERAHLRARHDLVVEYFTVLHEAAPASVRAPEALREVRLLVEVLADRVARHAAGDVALARALVSLAGAVHPSQALAVSTDSSATRVRMDLLARPEAPRALGLAMYGFALSVVAAPALLVALAWA
jgi:bla regulator protein blaR1